MKPLRFSLAIIFAAGFSANAQTNATTDPVGFVSYTLNANSDQPLGTPMVPAATFQAQSTSVVGVNVGVSNVPSFTGVNYLLVTSGPAVGSWEQISTTSSNNIVLNAPITGFTASNSFVVRAFWTLATLFPSGSGFPESPDPFAPSATVSVYNPSEIGVNQASSASYFYYPGPQDAGWYIVGNIDAGVQDNVPLSPETSISLRNSTGNSATITIVGSVPAKSLGLNIASKSTTPQDNMVFNQFPSDVTLANSQLVSSGAVIASSDPFSPGDTVSLYALRNSGFNPATSVSYFYYNATPEDTGWYIVGNIDAGKQDSSIIPAGSSFIIRKAQAANQDTLFAPSLPYNLN